MLVVPTFADVEHAQRELAERGRDLRGARDALRVAVRRDRGARGLRRPPRVRLPARADRRGGGAPGAARACSRSPPPSRASCAPRRASSPSWDRFVTRSSAARLTRRSARLGRRWPAPPVRRRDRRDLPRLPRGPRGRRARGRRAVSPWRRSTRCGRAARGRAWGRHARLRLRLRRLQRAPARRARDAVAALRRGRDGLAAVRARPAGVQGGEPACTRSCSRSARDELELAPLDDHYADESRAALHQVERRLFEDEPDEPVEPGQAISFHSAGGERAEVELAARGVLELLRDGVAPGDVAVVFRDPTALLVAARAGLRRLRHPVLDRPHAAVRAHRARPRAARADPRRPARPARRDDLLAYLRTPGPAAACRASPTASRPRSAARARTAPPRRARAGSATAGRSRSSTGSRGARDTDAFVGRAGAPPRAPVRRPLPAARATVLSGPQLEEARAFAEAQKALAELRAVLGARPRRRRRRCCA